MSSACSLRPSVVARTAAFALAATLFAAPTLAQHRAVDVTRVLPPRPAALGAARAVTANGVSWTFVDSVTACPAGDSVAAGHPARLRIVVTYAPLVGSTPTPRAGVPPESLWVEWAPLLGGARANDQPGRAYADDSTDAQGRARIQLPSVSGCGALALTLVVSGTGVGSFTASVSSADADLDGRVTTSDGPCDLDWNGVVDAADDALALPHREHSHRNVLFGSLVRRTNLCETCEEYTPLAIGESTVSWSPDGRKLAFTIHTWPWADCAVFVVPSDPADGDTLTAFTFPEAGVHDYDPCWSPLGTEIAFGRADNAIWVKGIPGLAADTSLRLVTRHNDGTEQERGDLAPAISPDGLWVAFTRKSTSLGHWELWKTPVDGDTTRRVQITFETTGDDFYAQWSNDGQWLVYDRTVGGKHSVWRVPSNGGTPEPVLVDSPPLIASTPSFSPDGDMILVGIGPVTAAAAHTFDASLPGVVLPSPLPVPQYPGYSISNANPVLSPRLSPDGTRTALRTRQLWAARVNTSRPPRITHVASRAIVPRTPFVDLTAAVGVPMTFTVEVNDPEGDPVVTQGYFLHDGMAFDPGTRMFAWTPPAGALGTTSNVRFQVSTPSGGSAYAIARITVSGGAGAPGDSPARFAVHANEPNPFGARTTIRFDLPRAAEVRVDVLDASGRHVRMLARGPRVAGTWALEWNGRDDAGREAAPGLYLARVTAGAEHATRKLLRLGAARD